MTTHTPRTTLSTTDGQPRPLRPVVAIGVVAVPAAVLATTLAAALARAAGVDLTVPDGGEPIPLAGIAFVTGVLSAVGVLLALAFARWTARAPERFARMAVTLTVVSLAPPLLVGAHPATAGVLVGLHLVAAAVMIPSLTRALRPASASGTPSS